MKHYLKGFLLIVIFLFASTAQARHLRLELGAEIFSTIWRDQEAFRVTVQTEPYELYEIYSKPQSGMAYELGLWYDTNERLAYGLKYTYGNHIPIFYFNPLGSWEVNPEPYVSWSADVRFFPKMMKSPVDVFPFLQAGLSRANTGWRVPNSSHLEGEGVEETLRAHDASLTQWHVNVGLGIHLGKRDRSGVKFVWLYGLPLNSGKHTFAINQFTLIATI